MLEGLLIDGLPIMMQVSKTTNFNEEAFTYNVPNTTQVWVWKDGTPWLQLQSSEALGLGLDVSPTWASFYGSQEVISLEVGSHYQIRASADGFPDIETAEIIYTGRKDSSSVNFLVYTNGLTGNDCTTRYHLIRFENAQNRHYFSRRYAEIVNDPALNFPHLPLEEQEEIRRNSFLSRQRSSYFDFNLFYQEVYGTNGTAIIRRDFLEPTAEPLVLTAPCPCEADLVLKPYTQIIEADSTITPYLLAKRQYIDFGDAGLFSQQNLPPIPHNVINGYGYFGLANAYNFPLCN